MAEYDTRVPIGEESDLCKEIADQYGDKLERLLELTKETGEEYGVVFWKMDGRIEVTDNVEGESNAFTKSVSGSSIKSLLRQAGEEEDIDEFKKEPLLDDMPVDPSPFRRGAISCTGTEFCNLALIETKNRMVEWVKKLEDSVEVDSPLRVHLSGCNASCAQPQIADIGFQGSKTRKDGEIVEAVNVGIGGGLGPDPEFIDWVVKGVACEDAVDFVADMIREYKADSAEDETFRDYVGRVGPEEVADRAQNEGEAA